MKSEDGPIFKSDVGPILKINVGPMSVVNSVLCQEIELNARENQ